MLYGLQREDISFSVKEFPDRKKPYIVVVKDNQGYVLGQFKSMEHAEDFMSVLDYVCFNQGEEKVRKMFEEWRN